ncbi:Prokaryotic diacylglycerol kinase [Symmachiella macrocystis]|uniref:Prokaryotic diacylglycerol kinase n=1 Tax=Symmachiella macrocystis TaxID=2527985 RepID=A0A5C6BL49_9PLAN|nr:diacylglycerol kinase [Symmachiella macrocystis]TWU12705.1 Prokaryotic diacylglycerol kinase [Symmachiella macrocystis]
MQSRETYHRTDASHSLRRQKRPAWRQHLVLTERGVVGGIRGGSAFFVHFFGCSIVLATGYVLALSLMQWVAVVLSMTIVLAAEMFNQALRAIVVDPEDGGIAPQAAKALGISTAAVMMTILGGLIVVGMIFAQRVSHFWAE